MLAACPPPLAPPQMDAEPIRDFQQENSSRKAQLSDVGGICQAWPVNSNEAEFYRYGDWWNKRVELAEPMHKMLAAMQFEDNLFTWQKVSYVGELELEVTHRKKFESEKARVCNGHQMPKPFAMPDCDLEEMEIWVWIAQYANGPKKVLATAPILTEVANSWPNCCPQGFSDPYGSADGLGTLFERFPKGHKFAGRLVSDTMYTLAHGIAEAAGKDPKLWQDHLVVVDYFMGCELACTRQTNADFTSDCRHTAIRFRSREVPEDHGP